MEESKKIIVVISLAIIVIIVVASLGFYLLNGGASGISAMEGRAIADRIAIDWSSDAVLTNVRISTNVGLNSGGYSYGWYYRYIDSLTISNNSKLLEIEVFYNSSVKIRYSTPSFIDIELGKWTIDSNQAYEISMNISRICDFVDKTSTSLNGFILSAEEGKPVWFLEWVNPGYFDNPRWAEIQIDANTGEVLYVEADN